MNNFEPKIGNIYYHLKDKKYIKIEVIDVVRTMDNSLKYVYIFEYLYTKKHNFNDSNKYIRELNVTDPEGLRILYNK